MIILIVVELAAEEESLRGQPEFSERILSVWTLKESRSGRSSIATAEGISSGFFGESNRG